MKLRMAYVCADRGVPVFGTKGCSIHVQEMTRAFLGLGVQVELFAVSLGGSVPPGLGGLEVHDLPQRSGSREQRERSGREMNARLVYELHAHGPFDLVYERHSLWGYGAMEYAAAERIPGALEVNAPLVEEQATHRELIDRWSAEHARSRAFRAASLILPVSRDLAGRLPLDASSRRKCHVSSNGVDSKRFVSAPQIAEVRRPFTLGFVGGLRPWHGIHELATGFARMRALVPDARLLVVGEGPMRSALKQRLDALGVRSAARLTGAVDAAAVPALLREMDAVVAPYPGGAETYFSPLKLLEYMAAGRAIVASRIGQVAELIEHERNGLLHEPGDTREMTRLLAWLARDSRLRRRLGRAACASVGREHSWSAIAERVVALAFESVMSHPTSGVA